MSRSNYTDDDDGGNFAMWRGQVASAIRGKRGQKLLAEMAAAMDAMPVKELIASALQADGAYCALGVVGAARGIDMSKLDPEEPCDVAEAFDIARQLACEVAYINDEAGPWLPHHQQEDPARRWKRVRKWVDEQIKRSAPSSSISPGRTP